MIKYLFFVEREFHISLFENIINYISENNIGKIGILTLPFRKSQNGYASIGCRKDFLKKHIPEEFTFIENPYIYNPDITFIADSSYEKVEGLGKIVNIGHGTISKGSFYTSGHLSFRENYANLLAVPGIIHKQILEKKVSVPIEVVGIPKLDHLFDNSLNKQTILKKMKLNFENKTVLFAPTFNKELSILTFLDLDLREIIPEYFNIIIKLHGVVEDKYKDYFKKYAEVNPNIFYSENYNISESFYVSDVLISDVSSVIYEFLSTGKPVLLFDSSLQKEFKNYNNNDLEYVFRNVGFRFKDIRNIPELLFRTFTSPLKDYHEISQKFVSFYDGKSAKRVVEKSLELINEDNKNLMILIGVNNLDYFKAKYENNFKIVILERGKSFNKFLSEKRESFKKFPYIIFMDSHFNYSPLFPTLLIQHLRQNKNAKIVCSFNRKSGSTQNIEKYISEVKEISNERIGAPLTYLYSGKEVNIDRFEQIAFAFNSSKVFEIIRKLDLDIFENWEHFLSKYDFKEKILAQDCFLWKN